MRRRKRSWPFAAGLALFVAFLGVFPHARFSWLIREAAYFSSAYDEAAYAIWAFTDGGPVMPNRWLSQAALKTLFELTGRSWDLTMMLADVVFPVLCAIMAWVLAGRLTRFRLLRLSLALGLLFAQELFSFGCWTIWQFRRGVGMPPSIPSPPLDWRLLRSMTPAWVQLVVPDYGSPFLSLFRTPEPQVSQILFLGILVLLIDLLRSDRTKEPGRRLVLVAAGTVINAILGIVYLFEGTAIVVFEGVLALSFAAGGRSRQARIAAALGLIGSASILLATLTYSNPSRGGWSFRSQLPILTPAVIAAAVGLAVLVPRLRGRRNGEDLLPIAAACFGTVLVLTNQQLVSGWMISTRDWERYVDYPLVLLGGAVAGGSILRRARVRLRVLYAVAAAGLLAAGYVLLAAQDRVFGEEFLVSNLKSVAMKRAVEAVEARGLGGATLVLENPELASLVQFRLRRRVDCLLDDMEIFLTRVDPIDRAGGEWGTGSRFKGRLFEYFARMGRQPARVARILRDETDNGAGFFLGFLFDFKDWWNPITDGRRTRRDEIRALLPGIEREFEQYLETGDSCWFRPAVVLTRQSPAGRTSDRWEETFLMQSTVGGDVPLMNVHALAQTLSPRQRMGATAASPGACSY